MSKEVFTVAEVHARMANVERIGQTNTAYYRRLQRALFEASRRELKKDETRMPTTQGNQPYGNTITGNLRMTNKAKKEILSHTDNTQELDATAYAWNNPSRLRYVGHSRLGQGKDLTDWNDYVNVMKKAEKGIVGYSRYYFEYAGSTWLLKAARNMDGYETFYHIRKAK